MTDRIVEKYSKLFPEDWAFECGPGWLPLIAALCEQLKDAPVKFSQVKEKFGALRAYVDLAENTSDEQRAAVYAAIHAAEEKSMDVCELCGQPGKLGGKGWISTRCEICRAKTELANG